LVVAGVLWIEAAECRETDAVVRLVERDSRPGEANRAGPAEDAAAEGRGVAADATELERDHAADVVDAAAP
jgi:hypothetical protein